MVYCYRDILSEYQQIYNGIIMKGLCIIQVGNKNNIDSAGQSLPGVIILKNLKIFNFLKFNFYAFLKCVEHNSEIYFS